MRYINLLLTLTFNGRFLSVISINENICRQVAKDFGPDALPVAQSTVPKH